VPARGIHRSDDVSGGGAVPSASDRTPVASAPRRVRGLLGAPMDPVQPPVLLSSGVPVLDEEARPVPDRAQIPAWIYVSGLSGDGARTMAGCLHAIASWLSDGRATIDTLPWASIRFSHASDVRSALSEAVRNERYAPATANKHLSALRGALKAAWKLGAMSTDDYMRAVALRPVTGDRIPIGRDIASSEIAGLLATCRPDDPAEEPKAVDVRDAAVIAVAYLSGARRSELARLDLADVELDPLSIKVEGKGNRQRLIPLSASAGPYLEAWLAKRGSEPGPLFCPIDRLDRIHRGRGLSGEALRQRIRRRAEAAGVVDPPSPHDFRRTYAGDLLDAGADLPAVQQLMGHASPATTSRYDRRGDRARRASADRLQIPPPPRPQGTTGTPPPQSAAPLA